MKIFLIRRHLLAVPAAACLLTLAAPLASAQDTGGIEAGGATLRAAPATLGSDVSIDGNLAGVGAGRRVALQLKNTAGTWTTVSSGPVTSAGSFKLTWRAPRAGRFLSRAVEGGLAKREVQGAPSTVITVLKRSQATWYDQSGTKTACGVRLRKKTLGVANKTLPCGTLVDFSFRGRSITVPVIDRGPYSRGTSWDFTIETARRLGFVNTGRGTVGVLRHSETLSLLDAPLPGAAR
ncbi:MAG: hypothetical protein F2813_05640 [Actinobacteria bacterium]|uniref:Unannotated protein n=1 Tax=freshwater metagenome TaxID=449393 RepID=A0A6J5ZW81_9ZZZZ|nr:hypothetical protein [Actinomycetota bacterium]